MSEILNPAGFTPQIAVAFAAGGDATRVDAAHPLPTSDRAYGGAVPIVPGTDQTPQRAIAITCTAAGTVTLKLADDSQLALPVSTGLSILPFATKTIVIAGTSAVATYANLI